MEFKMKLADFSLLGLISIISISAVSCGNAPTQIQDSRTYELDHKTSLPFFNKTPKVGDSVTLEAKGKTATLEIEVKLIDVKGNEKEVALGAFPFSSQGGNFSKTIQLVGPLDVFRNKQLKVDHVEADLGIETNIAKLESTTNLDYKLSSDGKSVVVSGNIPPSTVITALEKGSKVEFKVKARQDDKDVVVLPFAIK
jgi:hypothetical protein